MLRTNPFKYRMRDSLRHRLRTSVRRFAMVVGELLAWGLLAGLICIGDFRQLTTSVPLGRERVATVPIFNAWTIGWNAAALANGAARLRHYWHAPIFYPQPGTFTFSEAQPTGLIVAPLFGAGRSGALAYNVYLMLMLGLNATVMRRLCRDLGYGGIVGVCGALTALLLPFVHWQSGVLQLTAIWGPLAVIWCLVRFKQSGSVRWSIAAGICSGLSYAACNYYGLFLSLLAPAFLMLLGSALLIPRHWLMLAAGALVAVAVAGPIIWAQLEWLKPQARPRSPELIAELSARPYEYVRPPVAWFGAIKVNDPEAAPPREPLRVGMGTISYMLALAGAIGGLWHRGRRQWTLFCLTLGLLAWLFSLGTLLKWGALAPYNWLLDWYPGLEFIRSPFRFAVIVQIVCVLLAAEGLALAERLAFRLSIGRWAPLAVLSLTALAVIQTWPRPPRLAPLPSVNENGGWVDWLRHETPPGSPIVCVPFPEGTGVGDYEPATQWMYLGLWHQRPLIQGYSGFFPDAFVELKPIMRTFPDDESVRVLRKRHVKYAVVRRPADGRREFGRLPVLYRDAEAGVTIYSLEEPARRWPIEQFGSFIRQLLELASPDETDPSATRPGR